MRSIKAENYFFSAFYIILKPIIMLNDKKIEKIKQMIASGRRHFGRPAASLTQLQNPSLQGQLPPGWNRKVVDIAKRGEEETSLIIQEWLKIHDSALLFDSIHIKGDDDIKVDKETGLLDNGDTDHIILCGNHVLIVDSKVWKGGWKKKSDQINPDTLTKKVYNSVYWLNYQGHVLRFGKEFPGGKVHMGNAIRLWSKYLTDDCQMMGVINIINDNVEISANPINMKVSARIFHSQKWKLTCKREFNQTLDSWFNNIPAHERYIDPVLAAMIAVQCCKPYNPTSFIKTSLIKI